VQVKIAKAYRRKMENLGHVSYGFQLCWSFFLVVLGLKGCSMFFFICVVYWTVGPTTVLSGGLWWLWSIFCTV
jgi:hypothetical protein